MMIMVMVAVSKVDWVSVIARIRLGLFRIFIPDSTMFLVLLKIYHWFSRHFTFPLIA